MNNPPKSIETLELVAVELEQAAVVLAREKVMMNKKDELKMDKYELHTYISKDRG